MLVDLIYGVPTWVMALVAIAIIVGLSLLGLVISSRVLRLETRRKHNEFVGFNSALVGVFFAVLLAFIAVAAWESFGKADDTAQREASLTGDLWRDAFALPDPAKTQLLGDMHDYVQIVLDQEWPAMARGAPIGDDGWVPLFKFHQVLSGIHTSDAMQVAMITETLTRLNSLYDARAQRILAAQDHIEPTVWAVVLLGAFITITFTYFFGMESFTMHVLMTTAVAVTLALIIVLILAFDYPFRGEVQVTPDGFRNVQHDMQTAGIKFSHPAE
jgi:amino acid transporter